MRRGSLSLVLLLTPVIVLIFGFYLSSLFSILVVSFLQPVGAGEVLTLANYLEFFSEPAYLHFFQSTLRIALVSTLLAIVLGYPLAYYVVANRVNRMGKLVLSLVIIMFMTSPIVKVYAWTVVLGRFGLLNTVLSSLGLPTHDMIYNEPAVILGLTHFLTPFAILLLLGPLRDIDPSLVEAAKGLGASETRTFMRITLPLSLHGVVSALLLCYSLGVSAFVIPMVLGGGRVSMMANLIYDRYVETFNPYIASAMTVVLLGVALGSAYVLNRVLIRWVRI
ncbi:MAG: ABC transporter permease [Candidatus Caldarchaeum sp.]